MKTRSEFRDASKQIQQLEDVAQEQPHTLENLSYEMLWTILDYLSLPERSNIRLTSSQMYFTYLKFFKIRLNIIFPGLVTRINSRFALSQFTSQDLEKVKLAFTEKKLAVEKAKNKGESPPEFDEVLFNKIQTLKPNRKKYKQFFLFPSEIHFLHRLLKDLPSLKEKLPTKAPYNLNTHLHLLHQLSFLDQKFDTPTSPTTNQLSCAPKLPAKKNETNEERKNPLQNIADTLRSANKTKIKRLQKQYIAHFLPLPPSGKLSFSDQYHFIVMLASYQVKATTAAKLAPMLNRFFRIEDKGREITQYNCANKLANLQHIKLFSLFAFIARSKNRGYSITGDDFDLILKNSAAFNPKQTNWSLDEIGSVSTLRDINAIWISRHTFNGVPLSNFACVYPHIKEILAYNHKSRSTIKDLTTSLRAKNWLHQFPAAILLLHRSLNKGRTLIESQNTIIAIFDAIQTKSLYKRIINGSSSLLKYESSLWPFLLNFIHKDAILTLFKTFKYTGFSSLLSFFNRFEHQINALNPKELSSFLTNIKAVKTIRMDYNDRKPTLLDLLCSNQILPDNMIETFTQKSLLQNIDIDNRDYINSEIISNLAIMLLYPENIDSKNILYANKRGIIAAKDLFSSKNPQNSSSIYLATVLKFSFEAISLGPYCFSAPFFQYLQSIRLLPLDKKAANNLMSAYTLITKSTKENKTQGLTLCDFFTPQHYQKLSKQGIILSTEYVGVFQNYRKLTDAYTLNFPKKPSLGPGEIQTLVLTLYRSSVLSEADASRPYKNMPRAKFIKRFFSYLKAHTGDCTKLTSLFEMLLNKKPQNIVELIKQPLCLRSVLNVHPRDQEISNSSDTKNPRPAKKQRTRHSWNITSSRPFLDGINGSSSTSSQPQQPTLNQGIQRRHNH
jgi:hypothetical protein